MIQLLNSAVQNFQDKGSTFAQFTWRRDPQNSCDSQIWLNLLRLNFQKVESKWIQPTLQSYCIREMFKGSRVHHIWQKKCLKVDCGDFQRIIKIMKTKRDRAKYISMNAHIGKNQIHSFERLIWY